jgi:hypothetical protein
MRSRQGARARKYAFSGPRRMTASAVLVRDTGNTLSTAAGSMDYGSLGLKLSLVWAGSLSWRSKNPSPGFGPRPEDALMAELNRGAAGRRGRRLCGDTD